MPTMPKRLNQLIAIEKTRKGELEKTVTDIYHWFQRAGVFDGFTKRYEPSVEGGQKYADERTQIQITVPALFEEIEQTLTNLFDLTASKDATNAQAHASIVVDGQTIAEDVPGVTLLMLDKQLNDLRTILGKMPLLDAALKWTWDTQLGVWVSDQQWTLRQEKTFEVVILYPHTDKHPAQVKEREGVKTAGTWYTIKHSGAIPTTQRAALLARVDALRVAIKVAMEEANEVATVETLIGKKVFDYLFRETVSS